MAQEKKLVIMKGAESYRNFSNPEKCVLCIHGFSGNPAEMRYFATRMEESGYSVCVPRLPGHGTSVDDMLSTNAVDWYLSAREAYLECASQCSEIFITGLSMGGVIASLIASEFNPCGIALVSTPYTLKGWHVYLSPLVGRFVKLLPNTNPTRGINDEDARRKHVSYEEGIPVLSAWELFRLIKKGMACLPDVRCPTLLVQSSGDEIIPAESITYIFSHLGSQIIEKIEVEKSNHVILCDYDKDEVSSKIAVFFNTCKTSTSIEK